ncbi:hypothetical protein OU789_07880 [Halocynthiibacter sp. C4]|uniref:hypothetical protein n=1 Tax=Halocynthiibacter sp. C4 TaxID=2992758 RepID=UPI00237B2A28|nr:hypothetical protein [Halocynthiibacter sp. C4]MDE0589838.1 hypothetical protein [Halocynthiibacter sp. C4]
MAGSCALSIFPAHANSFTEQFIDPEDNMFDVSAFLARGGFVPMPVIITEPAVDKGIGIVGQFVQGDPTTKNVRRTMVGAFITGNNSFGGGAMQTGAFRDGRVKYTVGIGGADLHLPVYPFGSSRSIEYNNVTGGVFGHLRMQVGETPWYVGPRFRYQASTISLDAEGRLGGILEEFAVEKRYSALGLMGTYDTRDNSVTPLQGIDAVMRYDLFDGAIGSDADFDLGMVALHGFQKLGDNGWSIGAMTRYDWSNGDTPFNMAPQISLRGISWGRYAGERASSTEIQLRKDFDDRWAGVAFAGYGTSVAGNSRIFDDSGPVHTYGVGVRYKIARKLGIDVGIDIARGPEETIWMLQFGHAWMRTME